MLIGIMGVHYGHIGDMFQSAGFSSDGKRIVTASDDSTARVWIWENPRRVAIRLRVDSGCQVTGFKVATGTQLSLPAALGRLPAVRSKTGILRSLETDGASRYLTPAWIDAARDAVLASADPARAWLAIYRALGRRNRANVHRLLVLESLEQALVRPQAANQPVLALALAATRAGGLRSAKKRRAALAGVTRRARELALQGVDHTIVQALALAK